MEQTKEVIICPQCKGAGRVYRMKKDGTPYMERGQPILEYCPVCDGEGRILKITTIEYVRFPSSIVDSQNSEYKSGFDRLKEKIRSKKEKPEETE
ncbi:MAG: hypothetical protein ACI4FX_03135 [Agathobacter sp.]